MDYTTLLDKYSIRLFDERNGRNFSDYALAGGWAWWDAQPFRNEGLVQDRRTGRMYRLTSVTRRVGRLDVRWYSVGVDVTEVHERAWARETVNR